MEGPPEKKQRLEDPGKPVVQANDCIKFHLYSPASAAAELRSSHSFPPEFTHQLFGDDEEIQGFVGLDISVWLAQPSFQAFVDVSCTLHRPDADDVDGQFRKHFPGVSFSREDLATKRSTEAMQLTADQLGQPISSSNGTSVHHFNLKTAPQAIKVLSVFHSLVPCLRHECLEAACRQIIFFLHTV